MTQTFTSLFLYSIIGIIISQGKAFPQTEVENYSSKIEIVEDDKTISIEAKFYNHSSDTLTLRYELETIKKSTSGKSDSRQSGKFISSPNSESFLAKVGLNIENEMNYEINLRVFDGEKLISTDMVSFNSNQKY